MRSREALSFSGRRWLALPLIASLAIGSGCSPEHKQAKTNETKTGKSVEVDEQQFAFAALDKLREDVASGKSVSLSVAKNTCIYWDNQVGYTVMRNPAFYTFKKAGSQLIMLPFVSSHLDGKPVLMNGPSSQVMESGKPAVADFPIGDDQMSGDGNVEQVTSTLKLEQASEPEVFPPAWMLANDGSRIAETQIVAKDDLLSTFSDTCHFAVQPETHSGLTTA